MDVRDEFPSRQSERKTSAFRWSVLLKAKLDQRIECDNRRGKESVGS